MSILYCIGYTLLIVIDTMLLQYGYKLYYCIDSIFYSCCLYFVFMLYSIFFQHHICIACALLIVRDAMLQQHSYKLHIQY
jgi:hypothetical protein